MSQPLRIGVLLAGPVQLLDASPIDLFGMLTKDYLKACQLPGFLVNLGLEVDIQYISETGRGEIVECTANAGLRVTNSVGDEANTPGKLDILMIPGPDPAFVASQKVLHFLSDHSKHGTTIMTVCTGIFVAGSSGILDGKRVTGPRALLSKLKDRFPKASWEDKRWVADGNIWTSGELPLHLISTWGVQCLNSKLRDVAVSSYIYASGVICANQLRAAFRWYYERTGYDSRLHQAKMAWTTQRYCSSHGGRRRETGRVRRG